MTIGHTALFDSREFLRRKGVLFLRVYQFARPATVTVKIMKQVFGVMLGLLVGVQFTFAMDAHEILQKVAEQTFGETVRVALEIKTSKNGKSVSQSSLWLIGRSSKNSTAFLVDFDEPKESRGLRYLIEMRPGQEPRAFMYRPSEGKTVSLAFDDTSGDMGGTGLSVADVRGFLPRVDDSPVLLREEKFANRDCWVIRVGKPENKTERTLWITKDSFVVLKSESAPSGPGKPIRTFRVIEMFKTERNKEFPRVEEVLIPDKGLKIEVKQIHGVFGIELPDELFDPEKFGTFKWRD